MRYSKKRVFSGIQPTGDIHIGNYIGAIRNWVSSQSEYENLFCIVDLHAITVAQPPGLLKLKTRELAGLLIAAGIDPTESSLFVQSQVSAHAELAWILNCFIPMGWMERMTQFKEKSKKQKENVSVGLFDYPALMAADILLYETDLVPVGEDQKQHLELTRDVAQRFNSLYGETFKLPEPVIPRVGARIMGLDDPTKKMSKSEGRSGHSVRLLDSPEEIRAKIMKAVTDPGKEILFDESKPGIHNLLTIFQVFTGREKTEIEGHFEGKGYAELKREAAEAVIEALRPLQKKFKELSESPGYIDSLLVQGAEKARPMAEKILRRVKERIGLG